MEPRIVKPATARIFTEGQEICREYFKTGKITFGTSYLLPGQKGATDHGHKSSQEVFFVSKGHVIIETTGGCLFELAEGDAIIIPETVPHTLHNIGETPAVVTWSLAPGE